MGEVTTKQRVGDDFKKSFGYEPAFFVRAPGRVNILGGHVDYSEGWVLPGAIEQSFWLAVASRDDRTWRVRALDLEDEQQIDLEDLADPAVDRVGGKVGWIDYPGGVAWVMAGGSDRCPVDLEVPGLDIVMASDLPMGAGVSSSAALEMAFVLAVEHVSGEAISGVDKARIGMSVENEYLGVQSGIMDQYASVHGKANRLILLDCRKLEHQELVVPPELRVLVSDSRIRRRLAGSDFNSRRSQCEQAVQLLQKHRPEIKTLRDVSLSEFEEVVDQLPDPLDRRARHAVEEMARVLEGGDALEGGDLETLGDAMKRSHRSSRDLYEVSLPELDFLAEVAWSSDGCYGARLAGGGFGGCVLSLVEADACSGLRAELTSRYLESFGVEPGFLETGIAGGAEVVELG